MIKRRILFTAKMTLMDKLLKIIWPLLVVVGVAYAVLFDTGKGLDSLGVWLIPVGAVGGIITSLKKRGIKHSLPLMIVWIIALTSLVGLYYGWGHEGFEGLIWIYPATIFLLVGLVMLLVYIFELRKSTVILLITLVVSVLIWMFLSWFSDAREVSCGTYVGGQEVCQVSYGTPDWVYWAGFANLAFLIVTLITFAVYRLKR